MWWQKECISCGAYLYNLKNNYLKCSACKKKHSKAKLNKTILLMELYLQNYSALEVSKTQKLSYKSVWEYFDSFRKLSAIISENEYETLRDKPCEYEEYFYIQQIKKHSKHSILDAQNFLTFDYQNHIYTILMPSLKKYKKEFIDDGIGSIYTNELSKFARDSKLINISKLDNNITKFWAYLEKHITIYKGVNDENFGLFLKEFEFKYNHTKTKALELLIREYF
jgi:transposase-like protein